MRCARLKVMSGEGISLSTLIVLTPCEPKFQEEGMINRPVGNLIGRVPRKNA